MHNNFRLCGVFHVSCFDSDGNLRWEAEAKNLVVNTGLQHALDVIFLSATQIASWFIGITGASPIADAGDTMVTHAGWAEVVGYDELVRQGYVGVRTGQTLTNSASPALFTIGGDITIGGLFVTTDDTKGGADGTLFSIAAFTTGDKIASVGNILSVTYSLSAST